MIHSNLLASAAVLGLLKDLREKHRTDGKKQAGTLFRRKRSRPQIGLCMEEAPCSRFAREVRNPGFRL